MLGQKVITGICGKAEHRELSVSVSDCSNVTVSINSLRRNFVIFTRFTLHNSYNQQQHKPDYSQMKLKHVKNTNFE